MKFVSKKWGYEIWIENNEAYCGKHLRVMPNKNCSIHYHKNKKETFYIIDGELLLTYANFTPSEGKSEPSKEYWEEVSKHNLILSKGDSFTIDTLTPHTFTSNTSHPCDFIEISTHHEDSDSYRILE